MLTEGVCVCVCPWSATLFSSDVLTRVQTHVYLKCQTDPNRHRSGNISASFILFSQNLFLRRKPFHRVFCAPSRNGSSVFRRQVFFTQFDEEAQCDSFKGNTTIFESQERRLLSLLFVYKARSLLYFILQFSSPETPQMYPMGEGNF